MTDVDVVVVGAGISGLATAWWLCHQGLSVEVWERDAQPGGKIRTDTRGGYTTERAAALVMNSLPEVNRPITETGLDPLKLRRPPGGKRYLLQRGRLVAVPMRLGRLITSPLWSPRGKLRLLAEPFIARGNGDETVSEFITRRLGRELLEKALEPYLAGPLASDPDRAEARAVLPRLTALEQRYGSLTAGMLWHNILGRRNTCGMEAFSFSGGMSVLVNALADAPDIRLRLRHAVHELAPDRAGWRITGGAASAQRTVRARHVVLSHPAGSAASLLAPLDGELATLLRGIEYAPLAVVHLGFTRSAVRHPLDGSGFLVPRGENLMLNGCSWMSSLFPERATANGALFSCYLGGARQPEAAEWDDERSSSAVLEGLDRVMGISGTPEMTRIDRHSRGLPLYHGAYTDRLRAIDARLRRLPGLHLEANYRGGVSVRDRIARGQVVAERIAVALREGSRVAWRLPPPNDARRSPAEEPAIAGVRGS